MKIQSLSISVPSPCPNNCMFCVSAMHREDYTNQIEKNTRFFDLYERDYINRLAYARDNGCNSVMLTGNGEPIMNKQFLKFFAHCNSRLNKPFRQIELQTSGAGLDDEYLRFLRNTVGVSIISLSLSALEDESNEMYVRPCSIAYSVSINELCSEIKRYDFTLRLSLNLTSWFDYMTPEDIFSRVRILRADQVTFRKLYEDGTESEQAKWVRRNSCGLEWFEGVKCHVEFNGRPLNLLPFGSVRYSMHGISVVIDEDCMNTAVTEDFKYLILREDCKLYSHWDDKGSLVF